MALVPRNVVQPCPDERHSARLALENPSSIGYLCTVGASATIPVFSPGTFKMKSAVLVFPGINRERDMARALKLVSGHEPAMIWHADTALPEGTDLVVVPG